MTVGGCMARAVWGSARQEGKDRQERARKRGGMRHAQQRWAPSLRAQLHAKSIWRGLAMLRGPPLTAPTPRVLLRRSRRQQVGARHPLLDGPRGDHADRARPAGRPVERGLHGAGDGHGAAALEHAVPQPGGEAAGGMVPCRAVPRAHFDMPSHQCCGDRHGRGGVPVPAACCGAVLPPLDGAPCSHACPCRWPPCSTSPRPRARPRSRSTSPRSARTSSTSASTGTGRRAPWRPRCCATPSWQTCLSARRMGGPPPALRCSLRWGCRAGCARQRHRHGKSTELDWLSMPAPVSDLLRPAVSNRHHPARLDALRCRPGARLAPLG